MYDSPSSYFAIQSQDNFFSISDLVSKIIIQVPGLNFSFELQSGQESLRPSYLTKDFYFVFCPLKITESIWLDSSKIDGERKKNELFYV